MSAKGLEFIARFEGMVLHLYNDLGGDMGNCTIGIGHLVHLGPCDGRSSEDPFKGGITEEQALELKRQDAAVVVEGIQDYVTVRLTQYQFDALVSFVFNVGLPAFSGSNLLIKLNQGDYDSVPDELDHWIFATVDGEKVPLLGLVTRREAEGILFSTGDYGES